MQLWRETWRKAEEWRLLGELRSCRNLRVNARHLSRTLPTRGLHRSRQDTVRPWLYEARDVLNVDTSNQSTHRKVSCYRKVFIFILCRCDSHCMWHFPLCSWQIQSLITFHILLKASSHAANYYMKVIHICSSPLSVFVLLDELGQRRVTKITVFEMTTRTLVI